MTPRLKRLLVIGLLLAVPAGLLIAGIFSWVLVRGPRMETQAHLRTFEAAVPLPPEGSLPQESFFSEIRREDLPDEAGLKRGEVYYGYYCLFCHGEEGAGHGPVGDSYMPVPADLRSARIQGYSSDRLKMAMLKGTGHEPVLEGVVPPAYLDDLAAYVRSLGEESQGVRSEE